MRGFGLTLIAFAGLAAAAGIDGKWTSEIKAGGKKAANQPAAPVTFDLKSDGGALQGSVITKGRRERSTTIQDGKLEGDTFSFMTVQKGKKGDVKTLWKGTLDGEQLKGTRTREGARRSADFTAKRAAS